MVGKGAIVRKNRKKSEKTGKMSDYLGILLDKKNRNVSAGMN